MLVPPGVPSFTYTVFGPSVPLLPIFGLSFTDTALTELLEADELTG